MEVVLAVMHINMLFPFLAMIPQAGSMETCASGLADASLGRLGWAYSRAREHVFLPQGGL